MEQNNRTSDGGIDMLDRLDKNFCPKLEEIGEYVRNPLFMQFCTQIKELYHCEESIEYSSCSLEADA